MNRRTGLRIANWFESHINSFYKRKADYLVGIPFTIGQFYESNIEFFGLGLHFFFD